MATSAAALIAAGSCFLIALWIFLVIYLWKTKCAKPNKNIVQNGSILRSGNLQTNGVESCNRINSIRDNTNMFTVGELSVDSSRGSSFESQPALYYISQSSLEMVSNTKGA